MTFDLLTLSGTLALLVANAALVLWLGMSLNPQAVRIDTKELSRMATERMFRKNLDLE